MMASSWGLRGINPSLVVGRSSLVFAITSLVIVFAAGLLTTNDERRFFVSLPIISYRGLFRHYLFEVRVLANQDFAEDGILPHLNCLEANQFQ